MHWSDRPCHWHLSINFNGRQHFKATQSLRHWHWRDRTRPTLPQLPRQCVQCQLNAVCTVGTISTMLRLSSEDCVDHANILWDDTDVVIDRYRLPAKRTIIYFIESSRQHCHQGHTFYYFNNNEHQYFKQSLNGREREKYFVHMNCKEKNFKKHNVSENSCKVKWKVCHLAALINTLTQRLHWCIQIDVQVRSKHFTEGIVSTFHVIILNCTTDIHTNIWSTKGAQRSCGAIYLKHQQKNMSPPGTTVPVRTTVPSSLNCLYYYGTRSKWPISMHHRLQYSLQSKDQNTLTTFHI